MSDITRILTAIENGNPAAAAQLLPLVYNELRTLARRHMAKERPGHTLQPTALVHEAFLRLVGDPALGTANRTHFFAAASEAMRRILIDHARRKKALRRGGNLEQLPLDEALPEITTPSKSLDELLDFSDALDRFAAIHPQKAKLVELIYFTGLGIDEAADMLSLSRATAHRHWNFSRAWLHHALRETTATAENQSAT